MFELMDTYGQQAVIKVIGVGGGGGNVVDHMVAAGIDGVEFINANTDSQALKRSQAKTILHLGTNLTKGLGCGANPDIGRQAAVEGTVGVVSDVAGDPPVGTSRRPGGGAAVVAPRPDHERARRREEDADVGGAGGVAVGERHPAVQPVGPP